MVFLLPLCRFFRLPRLSYSIESVAPSRPAGGSGDSSFAPSMVWTPTILELQQMEPATQPRTQTSGSFRRSYLSLNDLWEKDLPSCISRQHLIQA
jgi:hypothetical protein